MKTAMKKYDDPQFDEVTISWNIIQQELQCCGVEGEIDWDNMGKPKGKGSCWKKADCKGADCKNRTTSDIRKDSLSDLKQFNWDNVATMGQGKHVTLSIIILNDYASISPCRVHWTGLKS